MIPSLSLRPMTLEDLNRVLEIENQSYPTPWTQQNFQAEMEKPYSHLLVMTDDETDETVAGYIAYWSLKEGFQILNVAVSPRFRRQGIAKKLVQAVIQDALRSESAQIQLEVRKGNQAAIQLYQGIGFTIQHVRKSFYSNGEDAYQMALEFETQKVDF